MSEPAFPMVCPTEFQFAHSGLTKREWFAGMALVGTIMDRASWGVSHTDKAEDFATSAFAIADAMLAASKEPGK
jgi:hypothetical protein